MITNYLSSLKVNGISGWRLPRANKGDIEDNIYDTGELGHLYYVGLGNTLSGGLQQTGPFTGLNAGPYWTGTVALEGSMKEYYVLDFNSGIWGSDCGMSGMSDGAYVLAVHDGNTAEPNDISPSEGTVDSQFTIRRAVSLGAQGKVFLKNAALKVSQWNESDILCEVSKPIVPGNHDITVLPKGAPKKASPIPFSPGFTIRQPRVGSIDVVSGAAGTPVNITGRFFGNRKGKVYVGTKSAKVAGWSMDPGTGDSLIQILIPKGLTSGTDYEVKVVVKGVGQGAASALFHVE